MQRFAREDTADPFQRRSNLNGKKPATIPHLFGRRRCAKTPHSIYYATNPRIKNLGSREASMESEQRVQETAQRKTITYDGEGYTRESLEKMLSDYQAKNALDLEKFGQLSQAYQRLTKEMTR